MDETLLLNGQAAAAKRDLLTGPRGTGKQEVRLKTREQSSSGGQLVRQWEQWNEWGFTEHVAVFTFPDLPFYCCIR